MCRENKVPDSTLVEGCESSKKVNISGSPSGVPPELSPGNIHPASGGFYFRKQYHCFRGNDFSLMSRAFKARLIYWLTRYRILLKLVQLPDTFDVLTRGKLEWETETDR